MAEANRTFEAYVSHPSLGDEVVWGKIVFEGWRLQFRSERTSFEIPLVKLRIARPEGETQGVALYDPAQPEWVIHTLDDEILEQGPLLQQPHTRNQVRVLQSGKELKRRLKITGVFLAGFALVALMTTILMGLMVRVVVARIPVEWEQELGDKAMAELRKKATFVDDPVQMTNVMRAVTPLLRVVPNRGLPYKFYLIDSPMPNAFALPGGHVVITTSLLKLADRPEEIAGVVAHELAHVTQRHAFRKIISSAGPYLLCRLFMRDNSGLMGLLAGGSQLLVCQSFSQEYEQEADDIGWQYLVAAHIDPRGLADMLRKLQAEAEQMHLVEVPQAFSSHPATDKRIRRLEAKWDKLKDKSDFISYDH
jgi:predicted Zn-dependent protease